MAQVETTYDEAYSGNTAINLGGMYIESPKKEWLARIFSPNAQHDKRIKGVLQELETGNFFACSELLMSIIDDKEEFMTLTKQLCKNIVLESFTGHTLTKEQEEEILFKLKTIQVYTNRTPGNHINNHNLNSFLEIMDTPGVMNNPRIFKEYFLEKLSILHGVLPGDRIRETKEMIDEIINT